MHNQEEKIIEMHEFYFSLTAAHLYQIRAKCRSKLSSLHFAFLFVLFVASEFVCFLCLQALF